MTFDTVPVIETLRLRLRPQCADDFSASFRMWSSPDVVRHITGKPSTRQESWSRLLRNIGHWKLLGYGYWLVEERTTGLFVGEIGFADFKREIEPNLDGLPESGWVLTPEAHGKGYATEAVGAALAWADGSLPAPCTVCMIAPQNEASINVARKCGYEDWTTATVNAEPVILFRRARGGASSPFDRPSTTLA